METEKLRELVIEELNKGLRIEELWREAERQVDADLLDRSGSLATMSVKNIYIGLRIKMKIEEMRRKKSRAQRKIREGLRRFYMNIFWVVNGLLFSGLTLALVPWLAMQGGLSSNDLGLIFLFCLSSMLCFNSVSSGHGDE